MKKQWGDWLPVYHEGRDSTHIRVGKKLAGRLLDGREWNELPTLNLQPSTLNRSTP